MQVISLVLIIGVCFLSYSNIFGNLLVWDDDSFVRNWGREYVLSFGDLLAGELPGFSAGLLRPVQTLVYALVYSLVGEAVWVYRVISIVLHALASSFVWVLGNRLSRDQRVGLVAAIIFAIHPVHTEAVTWLSASFDLLGVVFGLASVWQYAEWRGKNTSDWSQSEFRRAVGLFGLGLLSNEVVLVVPGILLVYEVFFGSVNREKLSRSISWFVGLAVLYWVWRMLVLGDPSRMPVIYESLNQRMVFLVGLVGEYIEMMVWPVDLSVNRVLLGSVPALFYLDGYWDLDGFELRLDPAHVVAVCGYVLSLGIGWKWRQKWPFLGFGLVWFGMWLVPFLHIFQQPILLAERYVYAASVGFAWVVGWVWVSFWQRTSLIGRGLLVGLSLGVAVWWVDLARERNRVWQNSQTLWGKTLEQNPESGVARLNLASAYVVAKKYERAVPLLEEAMVKLPDRLNVERNLLYSYEQLGEYEKALPVYQNLLEEYPDAVNIWVRLGAAQRELGNYQEARVAFERALELRSDDERILRLLETVSGEK